MVESEANVLKDNFCICSHPFDMAHLGKGYHPHWQKCNDFILKHKKKNKKDARLLAVLSLFSSLTQLLTAKLKTRWVSPAPDVGRDTSCQRHKSWDGLGEHGKGNRRAQNIWGQDHISVSLLPGNLNQQCLRLLLETLLQTSV